MSKFAVYQSTPDALDGDEIPTSDEKAALAGTFGTPDGANPFVTDSDPRNVNPRTPDVHAGSHEDGGGDEISVTGLSGLLADPQTPTAHAASHGVAGSDPIPAKALIVFGIFGAVPSSVSEFLYPGANATTPAEVQIEIRQARTFNRISVKATAAPGGVLVDTYTVRKNGADTALVTSLTGAAVENHDDTQSVAFAAGDLLSIRVDTALLSASTDPMVTLESV